MLGRSNRQKTVRRQPGQIVRIDLGDGAHSYAQVLTEPLLAFYDRVYEGSGPALEEIIALPVAFTLMVMNHAVKNGRWPVVGRAPIPPALDWPPPFCKQDAITGELSIYQEIPELAPHYERPAAPAECKGLETAAVWDPEHVEDRLRDHFAGRPNKWVEQLQPRLA